MLPLRPPVGKPAALVCTYAATGHNSAVLDLDVTEDNMFTASKGMYRITAYTPPPAVSLILSLVRKYRNNC